MQRTDPDKLLTNAETIEAILDYQETLQISQRLNLKIIDICDKIIVRQKFNLKLTATEDQDDYFQIAFLGIYEALPKLKVNPEKNIFNLLYTIGLNCIFGDKKWHKKEAHRMEVWKDALDPKYVGEQNRGDSY